MHQLGTFQGGTNVGQGIRRSRCNADNVRRSWSYVCWRNRSHELRWNKRCILLWHGLARHRQSQHPIGIDFRQRTRKGCHRGTRSSVGSSLSPCDQTGSIRRQSLSLCCIGVRIRHNRKQLKLDALGRRECWPMSSPLQPRPYWAAGGSLRRVIEGEGLGASLRRSLLILSLLLGSPRSTPRRAKSSHQRTPTGWDFL